MAIAELTSINRQWIVNGTLPLYGGQMASSEVDRKFLGHFAKATINEHGYLSSFLFRILGLSVVLSEDLLQARRAKRLDPVRDPQHRRLVHHILWLAREGLVMMEQYVQPMVGKRLPPELQVLVLKLKASLYHIFVLFHNEPSVNDRMTSSLFPLPLSPRSRSSTSPTSPPTATRQRSPAISLGKTPPGLSYPPATFSAGAGPYAFTYANVPSSASATYLLPLADYRSPATTAFKEADVLAERLLPGSHPVRLSVKVEYVAYLYDCVKEREASRRLAKRAVREVYEETAGMDDESFEDAAELVGMLGRMMKRGLSTSSGSGGGGADGSGRSTTSPAQGQGQGHGRQPSAAQQHPQPQQPNTTTRTASQRSTASASASRNAETGGVRPSGSSSGNGNGNGHRRSQTATRSDREGRTTVGDRARNTGDAHSGNGHNSQQRHGATATQQQQQQHRRAQSSSQTMQGGQVITAATAGSSSGSGRSRRSGGGNDNNGRRGGRGASTSQPTTWV